MKNYAIIENAIVINVVVWDGLAEWAPPEGTTAIEIPEAETVAIGDGYAQGKFSAADRSAPVLVETAEQVQARNTFMKAQLLTSAALAIDPLQDAIDLEMATEDDRRLLLAWKQYRVAVNRVDVTASAPQWPVQPNSTALTP